MKPAKRVRVAYQNLVNETLKAMKSALRKKDFDFLYKMNSFNTDILANVPKWLTAPSVLTDEQVRELEGKLDPMKAKVNAAASSKRLKK